MSGNNNDIDIGAQMNFLQEAYLGSQQDNANLNNIIDFTNTEETFEIYTPPPEYLEVPADGDCMFHSIIVRYSGNNDNFTIENLKKILGVKAESHTHNMLIQGMRQKIKNKIKAFVNNIKRIKRQQQQQQQQLQLQLQIQQDEENKLQQEEEQHEKTKRNFNNEVDKVSPEKFDNNSNLQESYYTRASSVIKMEGKELQNRRKLLEKKQHLQN